MKIVFEHEFPVSPEGLWPWLTEPERMCRWSTAPVSSLAEGPCGKPGGVGSRRSVQVGLGPVQLLLIEEIRVSDPPSCLEYQVVSGGGLRHHYGTIIIETLPTGSRLCWEIEYQTWLPGLGYPMRWLLRQQLGASLSRLQEILEAPAGADPGPVDTASR